METHCVLAVPSSISKQPLKKIICTFKQQQRQDHQGVDLHRVEPLCIYQTYLQVAGMGDDTPASTQVEEVVKDEKPDESVENGSTAAATPTSDHANGAKDDQRDAGSATATPDASSTSIAEATEPKAKETDKNTSLEPTSTADPAEGEAAPKTDDAADTKRTAGVKRPAPDSETQQGRGEEDEAKTPGITVEDLPEAVRKRMNEVLHEVDDAAMREDERLINFLAEVSEAQVPFGSLGRTVFCFHGVCLRLGTEKPPKPLQQFTPLYTQYVRDKVKIHFTVSFPK